MYTLTRFDQTNLPAGDVTGDMGSLDTVNTAVPAAGGVSYDTYGTEGAPVGPSVLVHRGVLAAASATALETAYRALLAKRGQLGKLYRTWNSSGLVEWVYARLRQIVVRYDAEYHESIVRGIDMYFENRSPYWSGRERGFGWTLDTGKYFDSGLYLDQYEVYTDYGSGHTVNNQGDLDVTNIEIEINPGWVTVTGLDFRWVRGVGDEVSLWTWSGSLEPAVHRLYVDTEKRTVRKYTIATDTYTDDYANFAIGASNPWESWVKFPPGETNFKMVATGATTTYAYMIYTFSEAFG